MSRVWLLMAPWTGGPARLLCPGKNTGEGCHALLQEIFPNQGSNPGLLCCRWILYHLSHQWHWVKKKRKKTSRNFTHHFNIIILTVTFPIFTLMTVSMKLKLLFWELVLIFMTAFWSIGSFLQKKLYIWQWSKRKFKLIAIYIPISISRWLYFSTG